MTERTYISAVMDRDTDQVMVWERPIQGGDRTLRLLQAPRYFFVPDENGEHTTITGERVTKLVFGSEDEFKNALKRYPRRFESDVDPVARALMDEYYGRPTPVVNYAFVDIETDYSAKLGFSSPNNPYAPINAVTIYQSWTNEYITYVIPPKGWRDDGTFMQRVQEFWRENNLNFKPNVFLCVNEAELLAGLLAEIEDADIISGWNSEFFDVPYIIQRLERVLGKRGVQKMSFKGAPAPRERTVIRFGTKAKTFTLYGRTHLDYLDLFKKFTFEGRVSYSLANIAAEELDVPKLEYQGTLEELFKGAHRPDVSKETWETASAKPDRMEQLNAQRELIRQEIERRGLTV